MPAARLGGAHCDMNAKMGKGIRHALAVLAICAGMLVAFPAFTNAQTGPPIKTTTPQMGTKGGLDRVGSTLKLVAAGTVAGLRDVYHFAKNLILHGGKAPAPDPFDGLREGSTVLVRYDAGVATEPPVQRTSAGAEVTEGTVIDLDRKRKRMTVRFARQSVQTFQLTDPHPVSVSTRGVQPVRSGAIVIEYSDASGRRVAYAFERVPDDRP